MIDWINILVVKCTTCIWSCCVSFICRIHVSCNEKKKRVSKKKSIFQNTKSNLNQFGKLLEELLTIKITLITVFIYGLYIIQLKLASVLRQNSIDLNSLILSLSLNTHKPYISPKRFLIMIKLSFNSTSISRIEESSKPFGKN